jgi:hypothetical protein
VRWREKRAARREARDPILPPRDNDEPDIRLPQAAE